MPKNFSRPKSLKMSGQLNIVTHSLPNLSSWRLWVFSSGKEKFLICFITRVINLHLAIVSASQGAGVVTALNSQAIADSCHCQQSHPATSVSHLDWSPTVVCCMVDPFKVQSPTEPFLEKQFVDKYETTTHYSVLSSRVNVLHLIFSHLSKGHFFPTTLVSMNSKSKATH